MDDALGRPGTGWLLELGSGDQVRAVDQIEGIFNRDRKVATYLPEAFDAVATHLLGRRPGAHLAWRDELFGCLRQAVEITALQRGVERWSPSPR